MTSQLVEALTRLIDLGVPGNSQVPGLSRGDFPFYAREVGLAGGPPAPPD